VQLEQLARPKVASVAITVIVILNIIGCGLLPKGAAYHNKKQAIVSKTELEIKINQVRQIAHLTEEEAGRANGSKKIVFWTSM